MIISIIVAASDNDVIGYLGALPWRLSDDLKHFKAKTSAHTIIMGRKTFETFPKPLPNRKHFIISTNQNYLLANENCFLFSSLESAINEAKVVAISENQEEIFIIGGGEIYKQALESELVDKIYLTQVHTIIAQGDTYFSPLKNMDWKEIERISFEKNEKNDFNFDIITYSE